MPSLRIVSCLLFSFLVVAACAAQQTPPPRIVDLSASDGTVIKGTYFASAKPGPGVLLLHQCNQQRKLWDPLGEHLASYGISVLTIDYRGFGESGGTPHDKLSPQDERKIETEKWPGDIDVAFRYLLAQPGVAHDRIGAGGASCGVNNSIQLARRHPEVTSLVLLSGPTDRAGREFLDSSKGLPIFTSAADDDRFGAQVLMMQWLFSLSQNPTSRFLYYATGGHGAEMFVPHPELAEIIAEWFSATLMNQPRLAPKTNGVAMDPQILRGLAQIDQPGGSSASELSNALAADRARGIQPVLLPEPIVNRLGYEHMEVGDAKGGVQILKLNTLAYPDSANAEDSLSDAYLADGQKDLALQKAKKAIALIANDTADDEQHRNGIRESAEQKIKQLAPSQP